MRSGFGSARYDRLVEPKDRWDPTNLFRSNHNVPPTGWTPTPSVPGQIRA